MKAQLKKLKGASIKTMMGQIVLKQYYRLDQSEFDQIYFKTNDSICKLYDLTQPAAIQRFNNQKEQYSQKKFSMLYDQVYCQQIKIKKINYGIVVFSKLDKELSLQQCMINLTQYQKIRLAMNLIQFLQQLKQANKIFCNIRPQNIYKTSDKFVIINAQFLRPMGTRNDMDTFLLETIQNGWKYWPSQVSDPYSHQFFDYSLDIYAAGCILYECVSNKYPFQTKLSAADGKFLKLDNRNIIGKITELFLSSSKIRRNINLKQMVNKLKQQNLELRPVQAFDKPAQQKNRKGSNNGIFDNISNVFSKMMNDSQGWFLNYIEDNQLPPSDKYLDNILTKMYKKQQKAEKLCTIIQKFVANNSGKLNSIKKVLLLIGRAIRKGPEAALNNLPSSISFIKSVFNSNQQIQSLIALLQKKVQTNDKLKKVLTGNFYLQDISNFKLLNVTQLKTMTNYLNFLVNYASTRPFLDASQLSQYILNFACDQIYDLVSMIIFSSISIRKDNQLQLRSDNLKQVQSIQKEMNYILKKLQKLSNYISGHAIYSLQGQYLPYQEQLMLKTNPYYSTIQYFYYSARSYKGLTVPTNYNQIFTSTNKQQKKIYSANKQVRSPIDSDNKNYFKQEVNSDEQEDFNKFNKTPHEIHSKKNEQVKKREKQNTQLLLQKPQIKTVEKKEKNLLQQQKIKGSNQYFIRPPKQTSEIRNKTEISNFSFQQFNNNVQKIKSDKSSGCINQFVFSIQNKKQAPKKPPLPEKKQIQNNSAIFDLKPKSSFQEFDQIFNKQKNQKHNKNTALSSEPKQLNQNKAVKVTNSDPFGDFTNEIIKKSSQLENPIVLKILQGLKLKQLKQLLIKNKKFVIDFQSLKLDKVIGSGSAGEVFHGLYKDQQVAIKRVKAKQNPNALKQFQRQLVTYIKIKSNPNLVSLVGLSQSAGDFYLVTQFCSYGSLFDLLHKKKNEIPLSWKQRLTFAIEIAEGMQSLHLMKPIIIHRDLKSLNVFVSKKQNSWKMKVADFGLSRSPEADMMTTQLGTIHWMAPELLQGKQYSYKVDVYSYGVLLWEILSRTTPYSNLQNPMAILKYVVIDKKRPDMLIIDKQCPAQLIGVMEKCWAHQPNDRPSFSQIIKLLKSINL